MSEPKLIEGHVYEFECGGIARYLGDDCAEDSWACDAGWTEPGQFAPHVRDLTIGPVNPITAEDVGRWALDMLGQRQRILSFDRSDPDLPVEVSGWWVHASGALVEDDPLGDFNLTRWLSARECAERGLAATHPSQKYDGVAQPDRAPRPSARYVAAEVAGSSPAPVSQPRKPGEFRVGDRVRCKAPFFSAWYRVPCTVIRFEEPYVIVKTNAPLNNGSALAGHDGGFRADTLELIEPSLPSQPAREGDAPASNGGDLAVRGASSTPSLPASDFERLFEFFKDKRPQAVPFALGQKVEAVAKREKCPTCKGENVDPEGVQICHAFNAVKSAFEPCPECGGSGWQEVK